MARVRKNKGKIEKKKPRKKTEPKKKVVKRKIKKSTSKKKKVKGTKRTKKKPEKAMTEEELIKEIAKLMQLGVKEKEVVDVLKEAGFLDNEIVDFISAAKSMYLPSGASTKTRPNYYEPNPWLIIITIGFLLGIAIFAILVVLNAIGVI